MDSVSTSENGKAEKQSPCNREDEVGNIIKGEMEKKRKCHEKTKEGPKQKRNKLEAKEGDVEVEELSKSAPCNNGTGSCTANANNLDKQIDIQRTGTLLVETMMTLFHFTLPSSIPSDINSLAGAKCVAGEPKDPVC